MRMKWQKQWHDASKRTKRKRWGSRKLMKELIKKNGRSYKSHWRSPPRRTKGRWKPLQSQKIRVTLLQVPNMNPVLKLQHFLEEQNAIPPKSCWVKFLFRHRGKTSRSNFKSSFSTPQWNTFLEMTRRNSSFPTTSWKDSCLRYCYSIILPLLVCLQISCISIWSKFFIQ